MGDLIPFPLDRRLAAIAAENQPVAAVTVQHTGGTAATWVGGEGATYVQWPDGFFGVRLRPDQPA